MNEFNNVAELQTQTVEVISKEMVENLRNNRSMATGTLARSIKTYDTTSKDNDLESVLEIGAWYAELVDKGIDPRGPGRQPPIEPIEAWIKRKSISVPAGITMKQFSFAIAKKIAKQGQRKRAYPFIEPSIREGEAFFERNINDALIEDVAINTTEILKSSPYLKPVR
jgi:hypothetical protein